MRLMPTDDGRRAAVDGRKLRLSPRLRCLADCVSEGARLADVGTDHGYLPVWLLLEGRISGALATDVNAEPLSHARRTAEAYGVEERIGFRLCDGLDGVAPDEADTIAIAGMGGETIADILSRAPWTLKREITLLLQPMTKPDILRLWLVENGYRIASERLVRDNGKLYAVVTATAGESAPLTPAQAYCGIALGSDPLYGAYVDERLKKLRRAAQGLRRSNDADKAARIAELESVIAELAARKKEWEHADGT